MNDILEIILNHYLIMRNFTFLLLMTSLITISFGCKKTSENEYVQGQLELKKFSNSSKDEVVNVLPTNTGLELFYLGNNRWRGGLAQVNIIFLGPTPAEVSNGILSEWIIVGHDGGNTYGNWTGNGMNGFSFSIACAGFTEIYYTTFFYSNGLLSISERVVSGFGGACNLQASGKIGVYEGKPVILDMNSPYPPFVPPIE